MNTESNFSLQYYSKQTEMVIPFKSFSMLRSIFLTSRLVLDKRTSSKTIAFL